MKQSKVLMSVLAIIAATVTMTGVAAAASITSVGGLSGATQTIDFSQFSGAPLTGVNGPVQIGGLVGLNITAQDMSGGSNIWLYNANWGLNGNGNWDSGRNGFLGIFPENGPVRIVFNSGLISGFGVFMNYPTGGFLPQTLTAFDSSGTLLETFDVGGSAPISTPGGLNDGAFRGIQRASADIAYIQLLGDTAVYDNLTFTAVTAVPEPITLSLFGTGLAGAIAMRRRKRVKTTA